MRLCLRLRLAQSALRADQTQIALPNLLREVVCLQKERELPSLEITFGASQGHRAAHSATFTAFLLPRTVQSKKRL